MGKKDFWYLIIGHLNGDLDRKRRGIPAEVAQEQTRQSEALYGDQEKLAVSAG